MLGWRRESEEKAGINLAGRLGPQATKGDFDQDATTAQFKSACAARVCADRAARGRAPQLPRRGFGRRMFCSNALLAISSPAGFTVRRHHCSRCKQTLILLFHMPPKFSSNFQFFRPTVFAVK